MDALWESGKRSHSEIRMGVSAEAEEGLIFFYSRFDSVPIIINTRKVYRGFSLGVKDKKRLKGQGSIEA